MVPGSTTPPSDVFPARVVCRELVTAETHVVLGMRAGNPRRTRACITTSLSCDWAQNGSAGPSLAAASNQHALLFLPILPYNGCLLRQASPSHGGGLALVVWYGWISASDMKGLIG